MMRRSTISVFYIVLFLGSPSLQGQTTGNVYNPVITTGESAFEYRTAYVPASGANSGRFAHRVHYQKQDFQDNLRWRTLIQASDVTAGQQELDFFQAELLWQFRNRSTHGWDSSLRFDGRISTNDRLADRVGVNWATQRNINSRWQLRGIVFAAHELGDQSRSGTFLETRARISYRLQSGSTAALEMFNAYGRSNNTGSFQTQRHRIGPMFSGNLGRGFAFNLGVLWGLSDAADNIDIRAALIKNF
tara:strand:+ start:3866 stop:4603 length:738 start_codon:yes stop_codon:yes gene_type:complete